MTPLVEARGRAHEALTRALDGLEAAARADERNKLRRNRILRTILIVVLVILLLGAAPTWPYSAGWGYGPSGLLGALLLIVLILAIAGRL